MLLDCGRTQRQLANHSSEPAPPRYFADQRCPPRPIVLNASVGQHVCSSLLSRTHSAPISTTILPLSSSLLRVIRGAAESEGAPYPLLQEAPENPAKGSSAVSSNQPPFETFTWTTDTDQTSDSQCQHMNPDAQEPARTREESVLRVGTVRDSRHHNPASIGSQI